MGTSRLGGEKRKGSLAISRKAKQQGMLGVELTSTELRLIELQGGTGATPVVTAVGVERLASLASLAPEARLAAQTQALRRCVLSAGAQTRRVALAVPQTAVLSALVPFEEGLSEEALELRVKLEAEHHLSTSLEAVALDFERLGARGDGRSDVLLVACRKEVVAEQQALAEAAGLEAAVVDVEGYALGRALGAARAQRAGEERVTALFLLGPLALQLFVYRGGRLLYARSDAVGFGEEAMLAEGTLAAYLEAAPAQAERALASLHGAQPTLVIDDVAVAGAGAALPGLMAAFEGRLGRPCWITDPFLRMALGPRSDASLLAAQAPALMVACGLALRGIPS